MKSSTRQVLEGRFEYVIYAPKGEIEGVLMTVDSAPVQIVIDKHDSDAGYPFIALASGQRIRLMVETMPMSTKGPSEHRVLSLVSIDAIDGQRPPTPLADEDPAYRGVVVRFNHAKHGEPNGVVLDTGDFIHTKPAGFKRLHLKVGQAVVATGDAQRMVDDRGWAVEATQVNGQSL